MIYFAKCEDLTGAVATLYSNGLCPLTPSIKQQLIKKHPFEKEYKIDVDEDALYVDKEDLFIIDVDDISEAINRTKITKNAGFDGLKPYYMRSILTSIKSDTILVKLERIFNWIFDQNIPNQVQLHWSSGKGTPLSKDREKTNA